MLNDHGETPTLRGVDDLHQFAALPFLRDTFGDDVLEPIRLHVDAKRYLCATRPDYYDALSPRLQAQPGAAGRHLLGGGRRGVHREAVRGGRRQRAAVGRSRKVADAPTPPLAHYVTILEAAQRPAA